MKKEWLFFCVGLYPGLFRSVLVEQLNTYAYPSKKNECFSGPGLMPVFTTTPIIKQFPVSVFNAQLMQEATSFSLFAKVLNHFKKNIRG